MADVERDRGQLIIVTGLLVAVAIVGLALVLNTAIYTENLASRGADQSSREAIEYRAAVVDGVGGLIDAENRRDHGNPGDVEANVADGIDRVDNVTARNYALDGRVVRIDQSATTLHDGRSIRQTDASRRFLNRSGTTGWRLADGIDDARGFTLAVDDSNLTSTDATVARTSAFYVLVDGGTDWEAFVYENPGGDIAVATAVGGGTPAEACSTTEPAATIDLTRGTLNGEPCPGLVWAEGVSGSYGIEFRHGDAANGTFHLTVNTTPVGATINGTNLNDGTTNPSSPYHVPAVYSAALPIHFESPTLAYRTTVRVAPGEPA